MLAHSGGERCRRRDQSAVDRNHLALTQLILYVPIANSLDKHGSPLNKDPSSSCVPRRLRLISGPPRLPLLVLLVLALGRREWCVLRSRGHVSRGGRAPPPHRRGEGRGAPCGGGSGRGRSGPAGAARAAGPGPVAAASSLQSQERPTAGASGPPPRPAPARPRLSLRSQLGGQSPPPRHGRRQQRAGRRP